MALRSILGGSGRVKKASKRTGAKRSSSTSSASPSPASWTSSLRRTKPAASQSKKTLPDDTADDEYDLDDHGLVRALATDLHLRDAAQAIAYIRARMFSPVPERASGMTSTRVAEVLNYRVRLPPLVTVSHIQALLASPSAVERELAALGRAGFVRRVAVPRRGPLGDSVMLAEDYAAMVAAAGDLEEGLKARFTRYLEQRAGSQRQQDVPDGALPPADVQRLVRAGFVTAHHTGLAHHGGSSGVLATHSRPAADRNTLTSLDAVSRQAAGSLAAVGGPGALHNAGGSGAGRLATGAAAAAAADDDDDARPRGAATTGLKLAVPGHGSFVELLARAVDHLADLVVRGGTQLPESVLRDRWDGAVDYPARKGGGGGGLHGGFGVLPGHTRKWRRFYGLAFEFVLQEAVGAGRVEVFETGSVGRGVRVV
ncbi:serine-threonine protein kinase 19-domain-containing protein [Xylariomycetidae sp. FL0641]|nr:serine-threonine protein kinase 19-domain-containing protein [Xylariomycetidae sp. FL0641]